MLRELLYVYIIFAEIHLTPAIVVLRKSRHFLSLSAYLPPFLSRSKLSFRRACAWGLKGTNLSRAELQFGPPLSPMLGRILVRTAIERTKGHSKAGLRPANRVVAPSLSALLVRKAQQLASNLSALCTLHLRRLTKRTSALHQTTDKPGLLFTDRRQ